MREWVHYAVPRRKRPKLTLADQERFLKQKKAVDDKIAQLKRKEGK